MAYICKIESWRNLPISNPKPGLQNINSHIKISENRLILLKLSSGNENTDLWWAEQSAKTDEICPMTIPNHSPLIYTCTSHLNKIHHKLFKLESGNQALTDGRTLEVENIIPNHFHVAGYNKYLRVSLNLILGWRAYDH